MYLYSFLASPLPTVRSAPLLFIPNLKSRAIQNFNAYKLITSLCLSKTKLETSKTGFFMIRPNQRSFVSIADPNQIIKKKQVLLDWLETWTDPENSVRGSPIFLFCFFSHQCISHSTVLTWDPQKVTEPKGSNCFSKGSIPGYLRKPIATFDFPERVRTLCNPPSPLDPPMGNQNEFLFDLILYVPSTIFQLNRDGSSWVEPVLLARINVSCSMTTTQ